MTAAVYLGDCRDLLRWLPDCSVDAIVTDPPYEIGFMGHGWDASRIAFDREVWREALRVLKPGGHVVAYGAARTYHWLACAVELAGFEIRDMVPWLQGQGMPHGIDVSKRIDAMAGAEREVLGPGINAAAKARNHAKAAAAGANGVSTNVGYPAAPVITAPATPEAQRWQGWNTQLAPGHEPCVLARKPLSESTVAANVLRWGVGALNVGACRLEGGKRVPGSGPRASNRIYGERPASARDQASAGYDPTVGRWPPNVTLSEAAAARLDAMVGKLGAQTGGFRSSNRRGVPFTHGAQQEAIKGREACGPSEFFYTAKAATREREQGCEHLRWARNPAGGFVPWEPGLELLVDHRGQPIGNPHPTIKPVALMRWLARMVCPSGGLILDPFMGSGTTGVAAVREGFRFIGSDITPWAHTIAKARIRWAQGRGIDLEDALSVPTAGVPLQASLF